MGRIAVATDSACGLSQQGAKEYGIYMLPMVFYVGGEECIEGITLSDEEFYDNLIRGVEVSTSQPAIPDLLGLWDKLLEEYDQIIYIPMSKALSSSCATAIMLSEDYEGRVFVVSSPRISVTQAGSALKAKQLVDEGLSAEEILERLKETDLAASIYITVESLKYLRKSGRLSGIEAFAGEILNIKPVIQIKGGMLEPYAKVRGRKKAKKSIEEAIVRDYKELAEQYGEDRVEVYVGHGCAEQEMLEWAEHFKTLFPGVKIHLAKLPLNICCHVGPGTIGSAVVVN